MKKDDKGNEGKWCPFRQGHYCGPNCGMFMVGMKMCVFHGINANLRNIANGKKVKHGNSG